MVRIRLRRMGARHRPFYRVVVSEETRTPRARVNEVLGTYDPATDPALVRIDLDRADEWVRRGARASVTVARLMERVRREKAVPLAG
jgi:small subunit ribosomal protein S16